MEKQIQQLVEISRLFGNNKDYITAGGGNTSVKNKDYLWVKASGVSLATITEKGFVKLNRAKLKEIAEKTYSDDVHEREFQVKTDLGVAIADIGSALRPSVESSLHDCLDYTFVVHTHPTLYNALLCGKDSKKMSPEIFGEDSLYIPYIDPGYTLFKVVESEIKKYREQHGCDPKILLLENHGIFVSANETDEIKEIYNRLESKLKSASQELAIEDLPINEKASKILPAIRMILSGDSTKVARLVNNTLVSKFYTSHNEFRLIAHPFTPDMVVYCKSKYIYIDSEGSVDDIIDQFKNQLERFVKEYKYQPKIVVLKNLGFIALEENMGSLENVIDVYQDLMKISYYSQFFGGPRFLSPDQIEFIDQWEVENYRRKVSKGSGSESPVANKIVAITGAAQGFGAGIAELLAEKGANLIIADINEEKGKEFAEQLSKASKNSRALFVKTNVIDPESVKNLIHESVCYFGGLDVFISNAGVLKAGGLDEMDVDSFDFVTDVNYKGYFICTKYASEPMKIQHKYNKNHFADIIQVNSKSGLKGSNKNFAYAGGKFGGIGLTQSFALELVPYNIKVNSICPGNFFDGPLWSDPSNGLFVQYLNAGKVPGAQNLEDVKKFYESQVPMQRGCDPEDVIKAILYVIDQKYETGQAVPVTGGQNMLK